MPYPSTCDDDGSFCASSFDVGGAQPLPQPLEYTGTQDVCVKLVGYAKRNSRDNNIIT